MATYKQKPRVQHHVTGDLEEPSGSEQGWVMFERRLVNNVSDVNTVSDDDWNLLSGNTSTAEEGIHTPESNSDFASGSSGGSGGSDYDSEMDGNVLSIELPQSQENSPSKMPSHDGTGNFSNTRLSNGSIHGSTTSLADSHRLHASDQDNEPMYNIDQNQQSTTSQILSTVWTTLRRRLSNLTHNIIISDDIDPIHNEFSHLAFASSNHNGGLASIITGTGENNYTYDSCYLPFGNHLALSELCPSLHQYTSSSSTPSSSSYNKRNSTTTTSNTTKIFCTPVSSSTSLKSFASRAGSDCGLESGRGVGRSRSLKTPLVI